MRISDWSSDVYSSDRLVVAAHGLGDGATSRHPLPIRQQVHGDEIDVLRQRGILEPDMPRLGGRYRHLERAAGAIQLDHQLTWRHVIAQQHFIADDGAVDVVVLEHRLYQRNKLAFPIFPESRPPA